MIQKIKFEIAKIGLKDWIIMVLLIIVLWYIIFAKQTVVMKDDTETINSINKFQKEIVVLNKQLISSAEKINDIEKLILINSKNTIAIQNKLKNEKEKLDDLSDDDNVHYFRNYIINYRLQSK